MFRYLFLKQLPNADSGMAVHTVNEEWFENKKAVMLDDRKLTVFFYSYAEKYHCKKKAVQFIQFYLQFWLPVRL